MMYLKVENKNIMGHDYVLTADCTVAIPDTKLVDEKGLYKYKYDNGLILLSEVEKENHPIAIAAKAEKEKEVKEKADKEAAKALIKADKDKIKNMKLDELAAFVEKIVTYLGM